MLNIDFWFHFPSTGEISVTVIVLVLAIFAGIAEQVVFFWPSK